jgi:hypothetical protein
LRWRETCTETSARLAVDRVADIIPLASRRPVPRRPAPAAVRSGPVRSPLGLLALTGAGLLFVAVVAVSSLDLGGKVRDLPPVARGALYRRSLEDAQTACALPAARDGALREHCLAQARFLLLFPECDARCQSLAASILPRTRR